jgi:Holliday junction resolvasome RuvABC endonuclease subunit
VAVRVLAIDLSLTETGLACPECGADIVATGKLREAARLEAIEREVSSHFEMADVIVLENYGYLQGPALRVIEAHGVIKLAAHRANRPVAVVSPASLKLYATGKGNAKKAQMVLASARRFHYEGDNENEADAWCLQAMGEAAYGDRAELPDYQLRAIQGVTWPLLEVKTT